MQGLLDRIALAFANPNGSHIRQARLTLKLGVRDPEVRARYGWVLFEDPRAGSDIDAAIRHVGALLYAERNAHDRSAKAFGRSLRPRLRYMTLFEAMLTLRWVRRHCPGIFPRVVASLDVPPHVPLLAAE